MADVGTGSLGPLGKKADRPVTSLLWQVREMAGDENESDGPRLLRGYIPTSKNAYTDIASTPCRPHRGEA